MSDTGAIWVYASHHDGRLDAVAFELLGKACELAREAHAAVEAVVLGKGVEEVAGALRRAGASIVRVADHPCLAQFSTVRHARVLADLASRHRPSVLLLGADAENAALAARVAARLGTGLSAHCVDLALEHGLLVQTVPGFGGQLMANIVCPEARPQMATVTAGIFEPVAADAEAEVVRETIDAPPSGRAAREVARERGEAEETGAALASAEAVVAGGYGVGSKENWALVEELAGALHAAVGATRPPVDEGWTPPGRMIGASGTFVAPRLYVALGISGMMHHVCGIRGAKTIVAVNSDARAPIFAMADYGIVGDVREVVPALLQRMRTGEGLAPRIQPPEHTRPPEAFKESLRRLRPNLYKHGRLVEDAVDDPVTRRTVEGHAQIFEAARDPRYQELLTTVSHLTGKRVSRYLSVIRSAEDMIANSRMKRLVFQLTGTCTGGRCAGFAALNAMWSTTWDIDREAGTDYHERLKAWLVSAQERDITLAGALTDPKGNRRLGPSKQADPDMYLRIVKRRSDGVVVRGAKVMICGTAAANEIFVMPGVRLRREDADYAVSFAVPKDAEEITIVEARHPSDQRDLEEGFDNPVTRGGITQAYIFF
jgi:electron transfer flavoprotein alpha subunit